MVAIMRVFILEHNSYFAPGPRDKCLRYLVGLKNNLVVIFVSFVKVTNPVLRPDEQSDELSVQP